VQNVNLSYRTDDNKCGLVTGGYIPPNGCVEENSIDKFEGKYPYGWELVRNGKTVGQRQTVVYLDSPQSNSNIFTPDSQVYFLPAAKGERKNSPKYVICLLLQLVEKESGMYKCIGLTSISSYLQGQRNGS